MSSQHSNGALQDTLRAPSSASESRPTSSTKRQYTNKKESMNGPLYMQTVNRTVLVRRVKRKGDGPSKQLARWFVENQIGMVSVHFFSIVPDVPLELWSLIAMPIRKPDEGFEKKSQKKRTKRHVLSPHRLGRAASYSMLCVSQLGVNLPRFVTLKDFGTSLKLNGGQLANAYST